MFTIELDMRRFPVEDVRRTWTGKFVADRMPAHVVPIRPVHHRQPQAVDGSFPPCCSIPVTLQRCSGIAYPQGQAPQ